MRVLPGPLKPILEQPLLSVPSLVRPEPDEGDVAERYDVFISHASEDNEAVGAPLAHALREAGLKVWYDKFELSIGDSLRRKIDRGWRTAVLASLCSCRTFFERGWTNYELDGIVTRAVTVLPASRSCCVFGTTSRRMR